MAQVKTKRARAPRRKKSGRMSVTKSTVPAGCTRIVSEGKTKVIFQMKNDPRTALVKSKDDITAGNGARHDVIPGKGRLATQTTCNVFRLLKASGFPVAFEKQTGPTTFTAALCKMLPYEVVVRREAHGSYVKRNPSIAKGHLFPKLIVEFYLKTKDRRWNSHELPCDDPLMINKPGNGTIELFDPAKPILGQKPFLTLKESEVFSDEEWKYFETMSRIAIQAFLVLEKAWQLEGGVLVDYKVEFGLTLSPTEESRLVLADVIDSDSWRVLLDGTYADKQVYRDGGTIGDVMRKYRHVAKITDRFRLPKQQIVIWCGSKDDDIELLNGTLETLSGGLFIPESIGPSVVVRHNCSMHQTPVQGVTDLNHMIHQVPDTVVIACVGLSNGAGPTLSANSTVPVISVPANYEKFPEDVWSSLRTPSNTPATTVLSQKNAALAALEILALRNPFLYMMLRHRVEERAAANVIRI